MSTVSGTSTARAGAAGVAASAVVWVLSLVACVPYLGDATGRTDLWVTGGDLLGVDVATHLDGLAAPVVLLATTVGLLVQVFSTAYLDGDPRYRSYAGLVVLFTLAMVTVVVADDLLVLVVGWEVMGICSYLLIGHHVELAAARRGAVVAFLTTRVGDLGLIVGVLALGAHYDTYRVSEVLARVDGPDPVVVGAGLLVLVAVLAKSAQLPFQAWLPGAMPGPTPVSALVHAATMVAAGVYVLARLEPLVTASSVVPTVLALVASATMLGAALLALVSDDLKRVLAWSTVSQLAYMFAAIAVGDPDAATAHLVAHGVFKALLFLSAGCVAHAVGSTGLSAAGGLRRRLPVTAWTSAVGFVALAGVVPTSGFFTKDAVLDAGLGAVDGSGPVAGWVAVVVVAAGLATVVVTAAYALRTWWRVFLGPVPDVATAGRRDEPVAMTAPLVLLAVGVLAYSLTQEPHLLTGVVTTVLVLAAAAVTVPVLRRGADPADLLGPAAPALRTEGGFERLNDAIGAGVGRVADVVVALDHQVVDAYPRGVAASARAGARLSDRAVTGNVQTYATVLAAGVAVAVLVMAVVVR